MKKIFISIEDTAGHITSGIRLLAVDRIKAAKIARMNSIPWEESPEAHALLAYCAARRSGHTTAEDFDQWLAGVADYELTNDDPAEDPTSQGTEASTAP